MVSGSFESGFQGFWVSGLRFRFKVSRAVRLAEGLSQTLWFRV